MKKLLGTLLLLLIFAGLGFMLFIAIETIEKDLWRALIYLGWMVLVLLFGSYTLEDKQHQSIYDETDEELLAFHPYYEPNIKCLKMFTLEGYKVLIVEHKIGIDFVDVFKGDDTQEYTTLRKDNPNYDKAKELILQREYEPEEESE